MPQNVVKLSKRKNKCFIACAPGLERLLAVELKKICSVDCRLRRAGIDCALTQEQMYRFCLWSRLANRVLYPLVNFQIEDEKSYYNALKEVDWSKHVGKSGTIAVDFFCANSCITHSRYGAQLTKDAVVDWFRELHGERPGVDREKPDIRINVYLFKNSARVSLDMSGQSLHRRNYRSQGGAAPLKENLAAAIVLSSHWHADNDPLVDPMCGSGTLLIEGAMIAGNIAPGIQRDYFGFLGWHKHDAALWSMLLEEAEAKKNMTNIPKISGFDIDSGAVQIAKENITRAGLAEFIDIEQHDFFASAAPLQGDKGVIVCNPPYGERLEEKQQLARFYSQLGRTLKQRAGGWRLALFTGATSVYHRTGLDRRVSLECNNGNIECKLYSARIPENQQSDRKPQIDTLSASVKSASVSGNAVEAPGVEQFADRLRKNIRQIQGWAKSVGASNYRIYDADLPDYAFALDLYKDIDPALGPYLCMQEYKAPAHIDEELAEVRLLSAAQVILRQLDCNESNLSIKRRDRQRGGRQYERLQKTEVFHTVAEADCRLLINIHDYLDCGLFLDHRKVRQWIGANSTGKRFLNLYCYTGAATVHAAVGGASETISVDLSQRYLSWAEENLKLNNASEDHHRLERADCAKWIEEYIAAKGIEFDLIFLDPPTFSNSAATTQDWDVQRDHEAMIERCMAILGSNGTLVFSNNFRRFKLSEQIPVSYDVQNKTRWSLQRDFSRSARIHQCWFIRHKA